MCKYTFFTGCWVGWVEVTSWFCQVNSLYCGSNSQLVCPYNPLLVFVWFLERFVFVRSGSSLAPPVLSCFIQERLPALPTQRFRHVRCKARCWWTAGSFQARHWPSVLSTLATCLVTFGQAFRPSLGWTFQMEDRPCNLARFVLTWFDVSWCFVQLKSYKSYKRCRVGLAVS